MNRRITGPVVVLLALLLALCLTGCGVTITSVGLPADAALIKGETRQLELSYGTEKEAAEEKIAEAAAKLTLVWTSSDEAVAAVDEAGLVTAMGAGEADITVSVDGAEIQSVCHLTVQVPLTAVEAPDALGLVINGEDSAALKVKLTPEDATGVALSYKSSDEAVAAVDETGLVTAVANGECKVTLTATADGGAELTQEVAVKVDTAPAEILLEKTEGVLTIGGSYTLEAAVAPEEVSEELAGLTWASSDPKIATVDETGKIKAEGIGAATITVTASNGVSAAYALTVQNVKCSYCGQEGHTSRNCPKKAADEAAAAAAQQAAAAQGGGAAGSSLGGSGTSGGGNNYSGTGRDNDVLIFGPDTIPENSGAGSLVPSLDG